MMSDIKTVENIENKEIIIGEVVPGYRITCKCGFKFFLSQENKNWYEENGMQPPKKCWHCRKKNKERNAKIENIGA